MKDYKEVLKDKRKQNERINKTIQGLRLIDDAMMNFAFHEQPALCAELIKPVIEKDDIHVTSAISQSIIHNTFGRNAILDVLAKDEKGKLYDIEMQKDNREASPDRARYYSSMLDYKSLPKGERKDNKSPWSSFPETYVIFFTEKDYYKQGKAIYHIDRKITDINNRPFNDREHIIYVNYSYDNINEPIGRLTHDLLQSDPKNVYNNLFRDRLKYIKEEGVKSNSNMCEAIEKLINEISEEREADREKETILAFVEGYYQDNPGITFDDAINFVASILRKDDSYIRQMIG